GCAARCGCFVVCVCVWGSVCVCVCVCVCMPVSGLVPDTCAAVTQKATPISHALPCSAACFVCCFCRQWNKLKLKLKRSYAEPLHRGLRDVSGCVRGLGG